MSLPGRRADHPAEKVDGVERRPRFGHSGITRADTIMGKLSLTPKRTVSPAETINRGLANRGAIRELFHHNQTMSADKRRSIDPHILLEEQRGLRVRSRTEP